jgi:VIT1/CCC1 family predicted Fe2+/Mn2+ transporter
LGANDGTISVTSLIIGMAASEALSQTLLVTCVAGLISSASSMAAGSSALAFSLGALFPMFYLD